MCVFATTASFALEWPSGDWSSRIVWEAKKALSSAYATSGTLPSGQTTATGYPAWFGNWNYTADDVWARDKASTEAGGGQWVGPLGSDGSGHFMGGECTYFVRLVLFRSSYWTGNNLHLTLMSPSVYAVDTTPGATTTNMAAVQPGWVLFTDPATTGGSYSHMAIAEKRETVSGKLGWWLIDSNWVGQSAGYTHVIGRHFFPDSKLTGDKYVGWRPHLARSN